MNTRNKIALALTIISLILLYPGLYTPILSIEVGLSPDDLPFLKLMDIAIEEQTFYEQTQSVVESIRTLFKQDNHLVAFLILFFSIVVPLTKAAIVLIVLFLERLSIRYQLYRFIYAIGKWAMADVFTVGVFIAFLSTKTTTGITAELHNGFYYFLGYCLVSLASIQVLTVEKN